jgi:hypothetical protein
VYINISSGVLTIAWYHTTEHLNMIFNESNIKLAILIFIYKKKNGKKMLFTCLSGTFTLSMLIMVKIWFNSEKGLDLMSEKYNITN